MQGSTNKRYRIAALVLVALVVAGFSAGTASAHDAGTTDAHGEIRTTANPGDCSLAIDTSGVDAGAVTFQVLDDAGERITRMHVSGTPIPTPGAGFAHSADVHLTADEAARVDQVVMTFQADGETHHASAPVEPSACEGAGAPPACPPVTDFRTANPEDPEIRFTLRTVDGANAYRIYRAAEGGDFQLLEQRVPGGERGNPDRVDAIVHVDEDVEPGVTYTYRVTGLNAAGERSGCEENEVTAIPFFGTPTALLFGAVGSVGAFTLLRRRN